MDVHTQRDFGPPILRPSVAISPRDTQQRRTCCAGKTAKKPRVSNVKDVLHQMRVQLERRQSESVAFECAVLGMNPPQLLRAPRGELHGATDSWLHVARCNYDQPRLEFDTIPSTQWICRGENMSFWASVLVAFGLGFLLRSLFGSSSAADSNREDFDRMFARDPYD
jgi:hypothetical protein